MIRDLVVHLDAHPPDEPIQWRDWRVAPVGGGANNQLFRATSPAADYAVKFTIRDDRDRAGREYAALAALADVGAPIAPGPVWTDQHSFRQPVVVQTWLPGETLAAPPGSQDDWKHLLAMYCRIHAVEPHHTTVALAEATLNVASGAQGQQLVFAHLARIPADDRPRSLGPLAHWAERWTPPVWPEPRRALCRVDSNWRNFIRQDREWVSVDWENSGWGDPAFEWADLITHPAYADLPDAPWDQLIAAYARRMHDPTAPQRAAVYTTIMWVWWVVRWARYLYEVPRGLDPRLAARSPTWLADAERNYERYLARAEQHVRQAEKTHW